MFTNPEQFANATKALFEFQLETFNTLTARGARRGASRRPEYGHRQVA